MKKLWLKFLQLFKRDFLQDKELIVKIMAVGTWADKVVHQNEITQIKEILSKINRGKIEYDVLHKAVNERIESYTAQNWLFQQDREEVIKTILKERNWDYAEYLLLIFKADNYISEEESEIMKNLEHLIEAKKFFKSKYDLDF